MFRLAGKQVVLPCTTQYRQRSLSYLALLKSLFWHSTLKSIFILKSTFQLGNECNRFYLILGLRPTFYKQKNFIFMWRAFRMKVGEWMLLSIWGGLFPKGGHWQKRQFRVFVSSEGFKSVKPVLKDCNELMYCAIKSTLLNLECIVWGIDQ